MVVVSTKGIDLHQNRITEFNELAYIILLLKKRKLPHKRKEFPPNYLSATYQGYRLFNAREIKDHKVKKSTGRQAQRRQPFYLIYLLLADSGMIILRP